MSFGRLLAAGRSWVGEDGIGRYRMQKHIRLPRFISPQNPFKPEPDGEERELPVTQPKPTPTTAAVIPAATAKRISPWAFAIAGLRRAAVFCLDYNPFSQIGQTKLPAIPRFGGSKYGRSVVQGELSLDKVKVVRGDLAHDDLEVVTVVSGGNQTTHPAWKNLTARIFGTSLK